jgi:hypothetical protein
MEIIVEMLESGFSERGDPTKCEGGCGKNWEIEFYMQLKIIRSPQDIMIRTEICMDSVCQRAVRRRYMREIESTIGGKVVVDGSTCEVCHRLVKKLKHCERCNSTYYCGRECQKKDWNRHKKMCKKLMDQRRKKESK